ncbi:MAG TPA: hypothetical protein VE913_21985 [Longimicrobium sp.]|nr:hypothetical protein [Longimicrobium sp.]
MRISVLPLLLLLPACASLRAAPTVDAERARLWNQGHAAFAADSFRVAAAAFQRLSSEFPRTLEGHEARFYVGVLSLEPRSGVDLGVAQQNLAIYVAEDSIQNRNGYHEREAETLLRLVGELQKQCEARVPGLQCTPGVVTRTVTQEVPSGNAQASSAEAARLRREVAERDVTIRELREELQRIRNTLAPRRQPR